LGIWFLSLHTVKSFSKLYTEGNYIAIYEFLCLTESCGVVTEHICSMGDRPDTIPCSKCGGLTEQKVSQIAVLTGNMSNPSLDVAIGKDAAERWGIIHDRAAVKDKIRKESGKQILAKVDGKYEPSTKTRLDFVSTPEPLDD
jgi:hypothetical protein